jgi:hypothetical protein
VLIPFEFSNCGQTKVGPEKEFITAFGFLSVCGQAIVGPEKGLILTFDKQNLKSQKTE